MKILRVIVDEMPRNCEQCDVLISDPRAYRGAIGKCRLSMKSVWEGKDRSPDCPLALEGEKNESH